MTRRGRQAWLTVEPKRLLVKGWKMGEVMRDGGFRGIYVGTVKAWIVDPRHMHDLIAYCEYRNITLHVAERGEVA